MDRPALTPEAQHVLDLARRDQAAAERAVAELPVDAQVALVCEAPTAHRAEVLDLLPKPELVIPRMPEAELCFTVKAIGLADATWILEHATAEQVVAAIDLDAWSGVAPDRAVLDGWLDALAGAGSAAFLRGIRALDPEIAVLFLKWRISVVIKPDDDWQPPPGMQTVDGQFYFAALRPGDDIAPVVAMLRTLFENDYWTYFRILQGVIWELDSENEEWALRWRTGRLQDLGFPPWESAIRVYGYLAPGELAAVPEGVEPLNVGTWHLPIWVPQLPTGPDAKHLLFKTLALLGDQERRGSFYAFVAIANKVAVADRMPLSDAESTPSAIEKAAYFVSCGLEFVAAENDLAPVEVLRRVPLERLFRVGANLEPEKAHPRAQGEPC